MRRRCNAQARRDPDRCRHRATRRRSAGHRLRHSKRSSVDAEVVPVRLDPELRAAVDARATADQTTTSDVIREALASRSMTPDGRRAHSPPARKISWAPPTWTPTRSPARGSTTTASGQCRPTRSWRIGRTTGSWTRSTSAASTASSATRGRAPARCSATTSRSTVADPIGPRRPCSSASDPTAGSRLHRRHRRADRRAASDRRPRVAGRR